METSRRIRLEKRAGLKMIRTTTQSVRGHRVDPSRGGDAAICCVDGRAVRMVAGFRAGRPRQLIDTRHFSLIRLDSVSPMAVFAPRTRVEQVQSPLEKRRFLGFPGSDRRRPAHWALGITFDAVLLAERLFVPVLAKFRPVEQPKAGSPGESRKDVVNVRSSFVSYSLSGHLRRCRDGRFGR